MFLAALWGLWHLPLFFMPVAGQRFLPVWAFVLWTTGLSVLMTWMYNRTRGNLLAALLFHCMVNFALNVFPLLERREGSGRRAFVIGALLGAVVAGLAAPGLRKLPRVSDKPGQLQTFKD